MESEVLPSDNRERKRGREQLGGPDRWDLVGRRVRKEFVGSGVFIGRILRFKRGGLYLVEYEDGDREDLEYEEVCDLLVKEDGGSISGGLCVDPAAGKQELGRPVLKIQGPKAPEAADGVDRVDDSSAVSKLTSADVESDADSSSDSCESETARLPPLALPPSSGDIGIPEESIGYLFSVYNFLRSFSCRLFLSPFSLNDFVGSLNYASQNSLLDAIHVSLMRALRRDLEMDSLDGSSSEFTLKRLRRLDWSLLDTLTWPVYVVEYLLIMGYTKEQELKGFHDHVLKSEYYTIPAPAKLRILQILCDDALDSAELRHEINMRGSMEVGMETDGNASLAPENGPRRVHPRYTKTSACKDPVAIENIVEPCESKPPRDQSSTGSSKAVEPEVNMSDDVVDTDECRLCAMDGTLLCCDGCPSVYHSRCIGLNKASLDEGDWFCPECVVNKTGPTCSRIGTGLRGAEFLGIDPHERAFLGTCNYLLVLGTSINAEPTIRYYSQNDVLKVLQVLHSSAQHAPLYSQICKGILQYWEISGDAILSHPAGTEPGVNSLDEKEDAMGSSTFCPQSIKKSRIHSNTVEGYNRESKTNESKVENGGLSFQENDCIEAGVNGPSLDSVCQTDLPDSQKDNVVTCEKSGDQFTSGHAELTAQQVGQLGTESAISAGSLIMPIDPSDVNHQSSGERSTVLEFATGASRDVESSGREDADSLVLQMKNSIPSISHENRQHNHGYSGVNKGDTISCTSFLGTSFKPQAYVNQYIPGDVAASAAAAIARLGSENGKSSESRGASKAKKIVSENTSLQVKAFAEATIHFLWPSSERKLIEIPREKCGWCLACKAPVNSRKGCLFNSAAMNALKGAARVLGGVRPIKIGEGQLASIAVYILHMEESLRGLLVGSLLTVSYRRHWRRQVELASSCKLLKLLLLELEENMHILALSGGWVKPVDDWSVESSTTQTTTSVVGPAKKRGLVRKNRKQSAASEITPDASSRSHINWWRGGKLSKLVFQKGILPHSIVKKAARQGGYKGIFGINYSQASEIPRRSRRLAWRAAVEMSKNASQLAFQVRCLDAHVRWNDLVRPDQVSQDGKASDTETFTFRNAFICDKKIVEGKTRYALAFGHQKHLPSRILKNIVEVETSQDGKEKMWFSENHIPLYLIKDYEEKAEKFLVPSSAEQLQCFSKFHRRPLKACRKDIFSYLGCRDDKCTCALCQQDVLLRNAVKCSSCQGCCHKDCTVPSTVDMKDGLEFIFTCNRCHQAVSAVVESYKKFPKAPLSVQGQHQMVSNTKSMQQDGYHQITKSVQQDRFSMQQDRFSIQQDRFSIQQDRFSIQQDRFSMQQDRFRHIPLTTEKLENHSERKPPAPTPDSGRKGRHGTCLTNGLIWKKKKVQTSESGTDFRLKNILLRGTVDMDPSMEPHCILCSQPYNSDLMYIRCQTCSNWYHADAVQLKEDQIFELEGFRCCKCRRKVSPICPYTDPERKKTLLMRAASRKQGSITPLVSITSLGKLEVGEATTPVIHPKTENVKTENVVVEDDNDPLLFSLQNVEPITEQMPEIEPDWHTAAAALSQTPQKLPVRRHLKQENEEAATHETNPPMNTKEEASCPGVEWEFPVTSELADFEGGSMEFEPQTYFSFTELLSTGDERVDGLFEAPVDVSGNWLNSSVYDDMGTVCQSMSPYNSFEAYEMGLGAGPQEFGAMAKPAGDELVPCQMCTHTQPAPDLICETCSLQIHSHCSPWDEPPSFGNRWRCGRCRDWR